MNWVDLDEGSFTTQLAGSRVTYTMTPLMFVSALLQYNSEHAHASAANVRLRWEYQPGSELFVVYNEQRDTLPRRVSRPHQPRVHREDQPAVPGPSRAGLCRVRLQPDVAVGTSA